MNSAANTPDDLSSRIVEAVILARTFAGASGRDAVAADFPPSVVDLYDAVVGRTEWAKATTLAERARVVLQVLDDDADLNARYRADADAGRLGFGAGEDDELDAAVRSLEPRARSITVDPGDGLLSGGAGDRSWHPVLPVAPKPAAPAPPSAAEPVGTDAETVQTWLNAELDNDGAPLETTRPYALAVFFGERDAGAVASAPSEIPIPAGEETIDLGVRLMSSDFTVPPFPQQLRVGRDGRSTARALFEITPLDVRDDDGTPRDRTLSILVDVKGNFLQRLDVTFDADAATDVANYGRPAGAAAMLDERSATLQLMPVGGGYELMAPQVCADPIRIRLTEDELGARIEKVRTVLLNAVKQPPIALDLTISPADGEAFLRDLAFAGFRLFQAIFAGPEASDDLKRVGTWLCETLADDVTTLQVVSTGFPVPWALMYPVKRFDAAPLSWDGFIGMRHVVEQIPMAQLDRMPPAPTIASTPDLSVRVLYNDGIDAQMPSHPVAAQRAYWAARGVALTEGTSADDLIARALAPSATDKVLYLYCHAEASDHDPDDSALILTGSQSVSLGQLSAFAPTEDMMPSRPLVFINACESGQLTPNFYDGFVPYFLAKGARGVIGTECKTPGLFASEWAKAFFDALFSGMPLGEVVLALRRRFLAEHNNPLGLLYGIHCDTDTVVAPALAASPTPAQ
ncbi:CHAT domain-containing protein [Microbacterium sp.]|uniref:CHAT domain-containing protein n=1 Tax=Microbacterium sp. TaxID=51671 RepID=UPI0039E70BCA